MADWFEQLECEGFALLPGAFGPAEVRAAWEACAAAITAAGADPAVLATQGGPAYGARNLFRLGRASSPWPNARPGGAAVARARPAGWVDARPLLRQAAGQ